MANSKRKCKHCGEYVTDWVRLPVGTFCTLDHAMAWQAEKRQADAAKAYRKRTTELKRQSLDNDRSHWIKQAQTAFNAYIRKRDRFLPCVSCGRGEEEVSQQEGWKPGGAWDCGHYLSVGSHPELRFEPRNAHRQCKSCNGGSANYARKNHQVATAYRVELIKRIGLESVEWLEGPHDAKKYTIQDLKQIVKTYKDLIK